ncbi:MAG TPA: Ger(x)C family spore germination protein [Symbiobacteriaceae bacterium]|jgi:spore germination protein KC|nr:Ger(x)C family spore germination protein [Symbiobacteriaceae bacterium]
MQRKHVVAVALLLTLASTLAGCWGRRELEEQAFVMAVGVDKGKESLYSVTFAIALPEKMAGGGKGGGGGGKPLMLTTLEAPTVAAAISMADSILSRQLSLRHTKALFMGEELAQISGMHTMDEFVRFREARRTIFYIVTKGKAADVLKGMEPKLEKDPQRFIQMITYNVRNTGMVPAESQIQHFVTAVSTGYTEPITYYLALKEEEKEGGDEKKPGKMSGPLEGGFKAGELPREGGPNIELLGGAAFLGEKMVGVLTGEDMRMILMLQDKFQHGLFSIPDPRRQDLFVSLELHQGRPLDLSVDLSGPTPRLTGLVTLEGDLLSIQSNRDYTEPELQAVLEKAAAQAIATRIAETVKKTQDWGTDVVGFGKEVVKQFGTVPAWEQYKWLDRYRTATVEIRVRVLLRRFGKQLSPPEVRTS